MTVMLLSPKALVGKVPLFRSLRYPNYRLYWLGMLATTFGNQIRLVAMLWLVYQLTGSPRDLGLVGGADGVATIVFTLFGGVLADRVDRRRLLLVTNIIFFILLFLLAAFTALQLVTLWHLIVFALLFGAVGAFDGPTRQALLPQLIGDRKDLMNAIALHSTIFQTSRIIGPSIAGLLIAAFSSAVCFFITAAAYLAMVLAIYRIKIEKADKVERENARGSPLEGVKYVWKNSIFSSIIGMVLVNSVFGMSFVYLMPVFAGDILKVDSRGYGLLMTFMGVGTLSGVLLGAMLGSFKKKYVLLLGGSGLYGLLLIVLAFSQDYSGAAIAIALAGFTQHLYMLTAQTIIQYLVPDGVRGRVMAIYSLVWALGPMGSLQAGAVATYLGVPVAIAIGGGVLTSFTIFLLIAVPRLRKLDV
ncbi:MAG: major facilitator superfamily 1 [Dehalococcoidia bacterium]|nr:major facilitator superfamily 1 [Dehalococcoidia bacterium]